MLLIETPLCTTEDIGEQKDVSTELVLSVDVFREITPSEASEVPEYFAD